MFILIFMGYLWGHFNGHKSAAHKILTASFQRHCQPPGSYCCHLSWALSKLAGGHRKLSCPEADPIQAKLPHYFKICMKSHTFRPCFRLPEWLSRASWYHREFWIVISLGVNLDQWEMRCGVGETIQLIPCSLPAMGFPELWFCLSHLPIGLLHFSPCLTSAYSSPLLSWVCNFQIVSVL